MEEKETVAGLKAMAEVLDGIQGALEPIRDKALDEKARMTGYAQCAEAMVKIVADRAAACRKRAVELAREETKEQVSPTSQKPAKSTTPV